MLKYVTVGQWHLGVILVLGLVLVLVLTQWRVLCVCCFLGVVGADLIVVGGGLIGR